MDDIEKDKLNQVLQSRIHQLEKDILHELQDLQKQVLNLKIHYTQTSILYLNQELHKIRATLERVKSEDDSVAKQESVEYWEHRKFITEQDIFWSERELVTWTEKFHFLLNVWIQ
jgi:predicted  nucleic acid-binding Zn-ribbon protein